MPVGEPTAHYCSAAVSGERYSSPNPLDAFYSELVRMQARTKRENVDNSIEICVSVGVSVGVDVGVGVHSRGPKKFQNDEDSTEISKARSMGDGKYHYIYYYLNAEATQIKHKYFI